MSAEGRHRNIALAVTGASGALYAVRTLAALLSQGCRVDLVLTEYGRRLIRDELGEAASPERWPEYLLANYGESVRRGEYVLHSNRDLGGKLASGSQACEALVIVPCSMKTMAAIAHGLSRSLVERAADVMLKERRPVVIVPRETPLSLPQLRNMVLCAEAGAIVLPAMPGFYHLPKTIDDLADFLAGKILSVLGFEHGLYPPWKDDEHTPPR
jgi:flavin prenyltransferase